VWDHRSIHKGIQTRKIRSSGVTLCFIKEVGSSNAHDKSHWYTRPHMADSGGARVLLIYFQTINEISKSPNTKKQDSPKEDIRTQTKLPYQKFGTFPLGAQSLCLFLCLTDLASTNPKN